MARPHPPASRRPRGGRAGPRARLPPRARRGRLRPAHVPLRAVGLRKDVLARARSRAAAHGDAAPHRHPRPELGLRAPRARPRERGRGPRRPLPAGRSAGGCARRRRRCRAAQAHLSGPRLRGPGRRPPPRPDRRPRGVLGVDLGARPLAARDPARARLGLAGRATAGAAGREPRRPRMGRVGAWSVGLRPRRRRRPRRPLPRGRPRLPGDARRAGARGAGRARTPMGAARRPVARARGRGRGAQRLSRTAGRRADRHRHGARRADRGRGAEVRPLPARLAPSDRRRCTRTCSVSATTSCSCA